jgi:mRNA interferase MazF
MRKGSLVLVSFPFTDLSGQKVRPALVLATSKRGEDCVVACVSSLKPKRPTNFAVSVAASSHNGLKVDSVVRVDKVATLQKKIVLGELGILEAASLNLVDQELRSLFVL